MLSVTTQYVRRFFNFFLFRCFDKPYNSSLLDASIAARWTASLREWPHEDDFVPIEIAAEAAVSFFTPPFAILCAYKVTSEDCPGCITTARSGMGCIDLPAVDSVGRDRDNDISFAKPEY